jgi:hypothetical protein
MTTNVTIPREELERLLAKVEAADVTGAATETTVIDEPDPLLDRARLAARSKSGAVKATVSKALFTGEDDGTGVTADGRKRSAAAVQLAALIRQSLAKDPDVAKMLRSGGKQRLAPPSEGLMRAAWGASGKRFNESADEDNGAAMVSCPTSEIWKAAMCPGTISSLFPEAKVERGKMRYLSVTGRPTVYATNPASECKVANCTPSSAVPTKIVEQDIGKLKAKICMPFEHEEDAFLDVVDLYSSEAIDAVRATLEHAILRGDTTTTPDDENINNFGDTIPLVTVDSQVYGPGYTAFDGLAHATLVDNTDNQILKASEMLETNDIRLAQQLMEDAALRRHWGFCGSMADLFIVCDWATYNSMVMLDEVKTVEMAGDNATLFTGALKQIWGIPIIATSELPLTSVDGTVDAATPANNVYGQLHLVNRQAFRLGVARDLTVSTAVDEDCEVITVNLSWRGGLARHTSSGEVADIEGVASIYGIGFGA